jgi:hypothetical protein
MRRLVAGLLVAVALGAACGAEEDAPSPAGATTGPTDAELAFREKIVERIEAGGYTCYCTGALRARERAEKRDR